MNAVERELEERKERIAKRAEARRVLRAFARLDGTPVKIKIAINTLHPPLKEAQGKTGTPTDFIRSRLGFVGDSFTAQEMFDNFDYGYSQVRQILANERNSAPGTGKQWVQYDEKKKVWALVFIGPKMPYPHPSWSAKVTRVRGSNPGIKHLCEVADNEPNVTVEDMMK